MTVVSRRSGPQFSKLQYIVDYNVGMKGVDLGDQLEFLPGCAQISQIYKKVFFYLFDLATVNSHVVYKYLGHCIHQVDFKMDLGNSINQYHPEEGLYSSQEQPLILPSPSRLLGRIRHVVRETPGRRYRRCFLCYRARKRKMTRTMGPEHHNLNSHRESEATFVLQKNLQFSFFF